jgi:hypothetical protein
MTIFIHASGALAVRVQCVVLDEAVYDVIFGTTALSTYAGGAVASVTGNVGGNVTGSVGSVATGGIASTSFASGAITASAIAADAIGASELAADAATEIATAVWAANPNLVRTGTAQAGGTNTITLDASASSTNGIYDPAIVILTGGTGAGQARMIHDYNGTSKVATVNRDWRVAPDNTTTFRIVAADQPISTNEGLAAGGGNTSITLNSSASSTNNTYNGQLVVLRTGTGQDQTRMITAYNGATKVATVGEAWATNPVSGTGYQIWPVGRALVAAHVAGSITSAAFAANAIDNSALASNAASEIATAVRTELTTELGRIDTTVSSRLASASYTAPLDAAGTRTAVGLASANLDTQLSTIDTVVDSILVDTAEIGAAGAGLTALASQTSVDTVDTVVDAIKAKTDSLTFTTAGQVDSNVKYVNDVQVDGTGTEGDPWGPV